MYLKKNIGTKATTDVFHPLQTVNMSENIIKLNIKMF